MAGGYFSILFIAPQDPAEAVAVSGLIPRLLSEIPDSRVTLVAGPQSAPLFAHTPTLQEMIVVEAYDGLMARVGLWSKLREHKWGLIVDMGGAYVAQWLHRRRRAERPHGPWRENPTEVASRLLHFDMPAAPQLFVSEEIEQATDEALEGEGPILAVGPGAEWVGRVWPGERYGQIAGQLMVAPRAPLLNGRIVAFGTERDREQIQSAVFPLPRKRIISRPYAQDLLTDFAWLKRARLYIGGDNIWTHLAAAAGVPTVALYGPSDDAVCAPFGKHVKVVRTPRDLDAIRKVDANFTHQMSHMGDLTMETVLTAARGRLLKGRHHE